MLSVRFYPQPTGDPGHDRHVRTLQFAYLLLTGALGTVLALDALRGDFAELPTLGTSSIGLVAAVILNRRGMWKLAGTIAFLSVLLPTIMLVVQAHDGLRSIAMLLFPGLLFVSVMLLDRVSYIAIAGTVLVTVTALGIAEIHGLTRAVPGVRSPTTFESIFYVDLIFLVFAFIGTRVVRDGERNVSNLRAVINRLSAANLELKDTAKALRDSELKYRSLYESITDAVATLNMAGQIVEANPAYETMLGYTGEELRRLTYQELTEESWHDFQAKIVEEQNASNPRSKVHEKEYRRRDGTVIPVEVQTYLLRDEANQPTGVWTIVRDITERKRALSALRASEQRFRATFFQAAVGIAQTGLRGEWLLVNDRLCEILGYSATELLGKSFVEITHPDDLDMSLSAVKRLLAGEVTSVAEEKRYIRKDGAIVWARLFATLVRDEHNQPEYFIGVVEDVTGRREAERALREAERYLSLAQSVAHLGVWERDLQTADDPRISPECARLYGLPPGRNTITLAEWLNAVHPDDREPMTALIRDALEFRHAWDTEYRVVLPDGSLRWLMTRGTVFVDETGKPTRATGITMDITGRKQAEAAVRATELQYKEVFDNFSECMFVLDVTPDGRFKIAGFNPAEEKATGLSNVEVAGKFIDDVLPDETARRVIAHYQRCLEVGTVIHYDEELNMANGARYFHTNLIPVRNEAGRIHRIVGCCMDFSELKRAQEEGFARQKLESLGTLASGIAHDFNNLLAAVLAQADLATSEYSAGASPREGLKAIQQMAIRGSEMVRQLMVYAGREGDAVEMADFSSVVEEMLALLKASVSKHATVEADLGRRLPAVKGKPAQIRQIVMNLVTNASEAMGDRVGIIRLTTRPVRVGPSAEGWKGVADGDYVQLSVSDTGNGMSPETQARVLDPFFTTKSAGRGLGLWVVHGIIESLGGGIQIASVADKGTTIRILLPVAEGIPAAPADAPSGVGESESLSQKFRVLVVEDEDPLREAVVKMLRRKGFEVLEAARGPAALDLLRAKGEEIDLILLDLTIPGASSQEVVTEAVKARPDVKVILTSAYSQEMVKDKISSPQIIAFIRKPFRLAELVKTLQGSVVS